MSFSIRLANGKTLETNNTAELAIFWETYGKAIVEKPKPKSK